MATKPTPAAKAAAVQTPQKPVQTAAAPAPAAPVATLPSAGSTAVALPSSLMERLASQAKDEAAKERPSVSKISLRGGLLAYQSQPIANNVLPCVILCAVYRNAMYDGPFDPNNIKNPVCFALSKDGENMEAHPNVPNENVPATAEDKTRQTPRDCDGCSANAWGSAGGGSRGKLCKETRRLVLLPASALESEEAAQKGELAVLDIPVTSGKNYSNFVNALAASAGIPPWAAVTNISTERDAKTQFKVTFTPTSVVASEEVLNVLEKRRDEAVNLAMTPYDEVASTTSGSMKNGEGVNKSPARSAAGKAAKF